MINRFIDIQNVIYLFLIQMTYTNYNVQIRSDHRHTLQSLINLEPLVSFRSCQPMQPHHLQMFNLEPSFVPGRTQLIRLDCQRPHTLLLTVLSYHPPINPVRPSTSQEQSTHNLTTQQGHSQMVDRLIDGCGKFSELHNYFHCNLKFIITI